MRREEEKKKASHKSIDISLLYLISIYRVEEILTYYSFEEKLD